MITREQKEIAALIGEFYLKKFDGNHELANKEIERIRFNDLAVWASGTVEIEVSRPGILIGKRGQNIEALQKHLNRPIRIKETQEHIMDFMFVHEPHEDEAWTDSIQEPGE